MNKRILSILSVIIFVLIGFFVYTRLFGRVKDQAEIDNKVTDNINQPGDEGGIEDALHPLTIESLRKGDYPGSEITVEQTLPQGSNYQRYIVSYRSEGLKIYGLLTVPNGDPSVGGWPVIILNHGYIPPQEYKTTERYIAYTDAFSRNGYVLFKPDYRGHGNSEGTASGGYGSNAYTIDVLNAVSSIKKLKNPSSSQTDNRKPITDPNRIGMWGHSMGGFITLRSMVANKNIKAGVVWAGVVVSYPDLIYSWRRRGSTPPPGIPTRTRRWRDELISRFGTPEDNPTFWNSISANSYLADLSGPLQLHHGTADTSVPVEFSQKLYDEIKSAGKTAELFTYEGDDHNISGNFNTAIQRSVEFFDKYLK